MWALHLNLLRMTRVNHLSDQCQTHFEKFSYSAIGFHYLQMSLKYCLMSANHTYSKTSMTWTSMTRLTCLIQTHFWVPRKSLDSPIKQIFIIYGRFREIFYFVIKYMLCTHYNHLIEAILMSTLNILLLYKRSKDIPKLYPFASWPGAMINPQRLKLSMSRTNLLGPKNVRVIEVWL